MSCTEWAFRQDVPGPLKLLLTAIAWRCDPDGVTFAGQEKLSEMVGTTTRQVRANLVKLGEAGLITRYRRHRENGSRTSDLIVLGMEREQPLDLTVYAGVIGEKLEGDQVAPGSQLPGGHPEVQRHTTRKPASGPYPSVDPPATKTENAGNGAKARKPATQKDQLPEGFPEELRPHARVVFRILRRVAVEHEAREVYPRAVGLVLMANRKKPLVKTAQALQVWAVDPPRPIKDVVSTYRTFLSSERELAGVERVPDEGPIEPGRKRFVRTRSVEDDGPQSAIGGKT